MIFVNDIVKKFSLKYSGEDFEIKYCCSMNNVEPNHITFIKKGYYNLKLLKCKDLLILTNEEDLPVKNKIFTDNPKNLFSKIILEFFNDSFFSNDKGQDFSLNALVKVGQNTFISSNSKIGEGTIIGHNVVISNAIIGKNCYIKSNSVIGEKGFGYSLDEDANIIEFPHLGNVIIEDNVYIGNHTHIDRGTLDSTVIKENTKIDNGVHIAHNCIIGKNCIIVANSEISGSCILEDYVWISPSTCIKNKVKLSTWSATGIGSVVLKNTQPYDIVVGNPAKFLRKRNFNEMF